MTCPVRVWLEGRSNMMLLVVKMGLLANALMSVDFLFGLIDAYLLVLVSK